jgi:site-specific recombinase XerD
VPAARLLQLGLALLQRAGDALDGSSKADMDPRQAVAAARDFRDGLIIALLASRPLRVKKLLQIEIGTHLRQSGNWTTLHFRPADTKNKRALDTVWPAVLQPALQQYLTQVRPLLIEVKAPGNVARSPRPPGAILWVTQGGTPLTPGGLRKVLARHTRRKFGYAITAHLFRDSVATTIANEDPNHVRYAARLLGHATLSTTEQNYIAANSSAALDLHHDLIASMRAKPNRRHPGRRHHP